MTELSPFTCSSPLPPRNEVRLPWGENSSKSLVHISAAKNGRACRLNCPTCGGGLDAKQGSQNQWHFAHISNHWCSGSLESLAHRRAKELIIEHKRLWLPAVSDSSMPFECKIPMIREEVPISLANQRRLDLLAMFPAAAKMGIEICVTHPVDEAKELDLQGWPYPSLEIKVRAGLAWARSEQAFIEHVLQGAPRRWISLAGWFNGTEEGPEADARKNFRQRAFAIYGTRPYKECFKEGCRQLANEIPEVWHYVAHTIASGQRDDRHHGMVRSSEVGTLLGMSAQAVGGLARKIELPACRPWRYEYLSPYTGYRIMLISPQGVIALWGAATAMAKSPASLADLGLFLTRMRSSA